MDTELQPMDEWQDLPWRRIQRQVFKLQTRTYRASLRGDVKTVHRLQRLLMKSWSAKCLAVRRVTQENQGKKTAGIDGLASLTPQMRLRLVQQLHLRGKADPTRRVYIPKPGSPTEQRPLSIPTMHDRALQTLVKLALEPEWEARFEPNNYGFRPGRSCRDAIGAIFLAIKQKPKYVLDADIQKCFEKINHSALLRKLNTPPTLTRQIRAWLKSGVMEGTTLYPTDEGTPQGGCVSPLLANVALHGMATALEKACGRTQRPMLVQYADDLVVLHPDLATIQQSQRILTQWLADMGLALKPSKTQITHTLDDFEGKVGFDFLGYNIRQYRVGKTHSQQGFKTIIKPSQAAITRHLRQLRTILKQYQAQPQWKLIERLNPVIRGWTNYYANVCSKATFARLGHLLYCQLRAWARRRHPNKSRQWQAHRYWLFDPGKRWTFAQRSGQTLTMLYHHAHTPIQRHIKVQAKRSPYDGDWIYWSQRLASFPTVKPAVAKLLVKQSGACQHCGQYFQSDDRMEVHHLDRDPSNYKPVNLVLVHRHCHDAIHRGLHVQHQPVEEPCEVSSLKHGFEDQRSG